MESCHCHYLYCSEFCKVLSWVTYCFFYTSISVMQESLTDPNLLHMQTTSSCIGLFTLRMTILCCSMEFHQATQVMSATKRRKGVSNYHTLVGPSSSKFGASKTCLIRYSCMFAPDKKLSRWLLQRWGGLL